MTCGVHLPLFFHLEKLIIADSRTHAYHLFGGRGNPPTLLGPEYAEWVGYPFCLTVQAALELLYSNYGCILP